VCLLLMIAGDHALTGLAIGKMLGIAGNGSVVTGPELDGMTDDQLKLVGYVISYNPQTGYSLDHTSVPEQGCSIVGWRSGGQLCIMPCKIDDITQLHRAVCAAVDAQDIH